MPLQRWQTALCAGGAICFWLIVRRHKERGVLPTPEAWQAQTGTDVSSPSKKTLRATIKKVIHLRRITMPEQAKTRKALLEVFTRRASGDNLLSQEAFVLACEKDLQLNMTAAELSRVFRHLSHGGDTIDGDLFVQCVRQRFFLMSVSTLNHIQAKFEIPATFDLDRDTAANYDGGEGTPFLGPYKEVRASRDHSYHGHYTEARQKWQDGALETVVQRS